MITQIDDFFFLLLFLRDIFNHTKMHIADGFGFEWTGLSLDEKKSGDSSMMMYGIAILAIFLCLAALYESWSIPLSVILVVPLGVFGVVLGVLLRGMSNDVYFQIGLITVMALSAKNAILIVEFAKELEEKGMSLFNAALQAAQSRARGAHDGSELHSGRAAHVLCLGGQLGQPACRRHGRDLGHDYWHGSVVPAGAGVLSGGSYPVQGQEKRRRGRWARCIGQ